MFVEHYKNGECLVRQFFISKYKKSLLQLMLFHQIGCIITLSSIRKWCSLCGCFELFMKEIPVSNKVFVQFMLVLTLDLSVVKHCQLFPFESGQEYLLIVQQSFRPIVQPLFGRTSLFTKMSQLLDLNFVFPFYVITLRLNVTHVFDWAFKKFR